MKTAESQTCVRGGAQILMTAESPEEEREVERAGEGGRNTFGYGRDFCLLFESKALGLFFRLCFHLYQSSIPNILWLFLFKVS